MKKCFVIVSFFLCLALVGCGGKAVGVVGGADGPTAVFVSENDSQSQKEPIRLVRADGKLYYDSKKKSETDARCGVMDGSLTKTAGKFEVPKGDSECNFSGVSGYQIGAAAGTIEIEENSSWTVFKEIPTISDVLKYKYAFLLSGRMPNAASDSTFLVLSNEKNATFDDAAYKLFGSDTTKMKDLYVLPLE